MILKFSRTLSNSKENKFLITNKELVKASKYLSTGFQKRLFFGITLDYLYERQLSTLPKEEVRCLRNKTSIRSILSNHKLDWVQTNSQWFGVIVKSPSNIDSWVWSYTACQFCFPFHVFLWNHQFRRTNCKKSNHFEQNYNINFFSIYHWEKFVFLAYFSLHIMLKHYT